MTFEPPPEFAPLASPATAAAAAPAVQRRLRLANRLPLAVLIGAVIAQIFDPSRVWVGLILGMAALLGFCYFWARMLRDHVTARREQRGSWVVVGDVLTEVFTVENHTDLPLLWAEVVDQSELPGYRAEWVATVGANAAQSYETHGRCEHRGVFRLGPWKLLMSDPLGLFEVVHEMGDARAVLVYPRAMHLPNLQLPRGDAPGAARTSRRTPQFTISASSVRSYVPGDSIRRVHWPRTAHRGELMVKEFDLEPSGDLWLVLDLDQSVHVGVGAQSTLEYGVTLAASLAAQMLADNRRVGLAAFGQQAGLVMPQAGKLQLWRILDVLAHAQPKAGLSLSQVLRDLRVNVGRGRTVVVITPSAEPAWVVELLTLARQGNAPAAILLDGQSFVAAPAADAAPILAVRSLLAEQGIPGHVIDRQFVFQPLQRIRRTRTELKTLYGTGRVVAVEVEELV